MKAGLCVQNNIIVVVPWLTSNCLAVLLETSTFVHLLSHRKVRTLLNSYILYSGRIIMLSLSGSPFQTYFSPISAFTFSMAFLVLMVQVVINIILNTSTINIICRSTVCSNFTVSTWKQNLKPLHQLDRELMRYVVRKLFRYQQSLKLCNKILIINH